MILEIEDLLSRHIEQCKTCNKNYKEDYCIVGKAYAKAVKTK